MKLVVTDTNVFIDLMDVGALALLFVLDLEVHTTVFVYDQLEEDQQNQLLVHIGNGRLLISQFKESDVQAIAGMRTGRKLEFTDRSVIHLASDLKAIVLSGDGGIRRECKGRGIEIHGTIWVVAELWNKGLVPPKGCIRILEDLRRVNTRLPDQRVEGLINKIRSSLRE